MTGTKSAWIEDEEYIEAAIRIWEKPREQENTLLIQRTGFDNVALGDSIVDRIPTAGAWVLAWVYVENEEVR